jgi:hypothetical protein
VRSARSRPRPTPPLRLPAVMCARFDGRGVCSALVCMRCPLVCMRRPFVYIYINICRSLVSARYASFVWSFRCICGSSCVCACRSVACSSASWLSRATNCIACVRSSSPYVVCSGARAVARFSAFCCVHSSGHGSHFGVCLHKLCACMPKRVVCPIRLPVYPIRSRYLHAVVQKHAVAWAWLCVGVGLGVEKEWGLWWRCGSKAPVGLWGTGWVGGGGKKGGKRSEGAEGRSCTQLLGLGFVWAWVWA